MTTTTHPFDLAPPVIRPEWLEEPINHSATSGVTNFTDMDEFWYDLSAAEAERLAQTEIAEHVKDEAMQDAIYRMTIDKATKHMTPEMRERWMANVVANQCLGIKPVFGKGDTNGNSN